MGCTTSSPVKGGGKLSESERVMGGRKGIDKSERIHTASERAKIAAKRSMVLAGASAQSPNKDEEQQLLNPPKLTESGRLVAEEVAKRRSGSVETKEVVLGDIKSGTDEGLIYVRYAAMTQRGYYPDSEWLNFLYCKLII